MFIGFWGLTPITLAVEGKWTKKADMPTARAQFTASAVSGKIYVFGGGADKHGGIRRGIQPGHRYLEAKDRYAKSQVQDGLQRRKWKDLRHRRNDGANAAKEVATVEEYDPVSDT